MIEKIIDLKKIDLLILFGANNRKLHKIREFFPDLKLISRNTLKVLGNKNQILFFEKKFKSFINHINHYNRLTLSQIERLILEGESKVMENKNDIILHGSDGRLIIARTVNQRKMVDDIVKNDMIFAMGPAGTGKTYTAVYWQCKMFKDQTS